MDKRVLIIESDEDLTEIFRQAAQSAGFDADIVASAADALVRLQDDARRPAVLIMDAPLTGMDSETFLRQLRLAPATAQLRVLVVAAHTQLASDLSPLATLALVKPVSYQRLCDWLMET